MSSKFDSFSQSKLGAFVQSPLGARGTASKWRYENTPSEQILIDDWRFYMTDLKIGQLVDNKYPFTLRFTDLIDNSEQDIVLPPDIQQTSGRSVSDGVVFVYKDIPPESFYTHYYFVKIDQNTLQASLFDYSGTFINQGSQLIYPDSLMVFGEGNSVVAEGAYPPNSGMHEFTGNSFAYIGQSPGGSIPTINSVQGSSWRCGRTDDTAVITLNWSDLYYSDGLNVVPVGLDPSMLISGNDRVYYAGDSSSEYISAKSDTEYGQDWFLYKRANGAPSWQRVSAPSKSTYSRLQVLGIYNSRVYCVLVSLNSTVEIWSHPTSI